ncbi:MULTISPECIES: DUF3019 domain-containing protein [Rheinheimera]|uniref:DUF3019 domain-containing protein n=1 Tax=Rheinheimera marina TaxID=1774958 RepID=A0ABV9JFZ8_9GAMM
MLGLILTSQLWLAPAPQPECNQDLCWSVSPAFCISALPEQACEAQLSVQWQHSAALDLCLKLAQQELSCWQDARAGQWQQHIVWPENATLSLQQGGRVLLQKELVVLSRQPEKRRRLVAPWSVF